MKDRRLRILVTDAHSTSALAVVRSLGSRGMLVTVAGESGRFNLAGYSRYACRTVTWPPAEEEPLAYLACLETELKSTRYDLLLPTTDTTVTLVSHHRHRLEQSVRIGLPSSDALTAALDKAITLRLADAHGVATPRTESFTSMAAVDAAASRLAYPCVIKPRFSRHWSGQGPVTRGAVRHVASPEALRENFRRTRQEPACFLVQELIPGDGIGVFALADEGRPITVFAHRRLREANPLGGRASLAESICPEERLVTPALRMLATLRWSGVAMVEFKDPGHPEAPVLMEINGRFWGSLPLAIAAGVDFPYLLVRSMLNEPVDRPTSYKVGLRCRHLKGDLSYLAAALKGRPRDWHGPYPSRLGAVAALAPWPGRWRAYNFRVGDPMPALREAGVLVREALAFGGKRA
ncbi:MAG: carboxylate--amine ligase [Acidobacteriota bacterium]